MLSLEQVNDYKDFWFFVCAEHISKIKLSEVNKGDELWYCVNKVYYSAKVVSIDKKGIVKTDSGVNFSRTGSSNDELSSTRRIEDAIVFAYSPKEVVNNLLERIKRHKVTELRKSIQVIKYTFDKIERNLINDMSLVDSIAPMLESIISSFSEAGIELWKPYQE